MSRTDDMLTHHKSLGRWPIFIILCLAAFVIALISICLGSEPLAPATVFQCIAGGDSVDPILQQIVVDFRLPRVLTALIAGAALATAGLLMQTIFRNPLADPFVLGVNSGASLGVAIALLVLTPAGISLTTNLNFSGQTLIVLSATAGAAATLFIVLSLFQRVDIMSLLIIGLMISYAVSSLVSILIFFSMAERLQSFLNWSFGDFGSVGWLHLPVFGPAVIIGLVATLFLMKPLDALLLGQEYAESIGTRTKPARFFGLLAASLLAGTVTGFCGPIGFLGIAAPHLARFLFNTSTHRILIPATLLIGGILALTADLFARAPGFDFSLPLNAITALIGAPVITLALIRQRSMKHLFG
ncbi:MAG: iron ABC transporter permease [Verrucomicrobiota bacterium]